MVKSVYLIQVVQRFLYIEAISPVLRLPFGGLYSTCWGFPVTQWLRTHLSMQEAHVQSQGQEDPWKRKWQPTPVFLTGKSHGPRNLVVSSPWGCKRVGHDLATKYNNNIGKGK